MRIIDIHTHLSRITDLDDPRDRAFVQRNGVELGEERPTAILLAQMDAAGIERAAVHNTVHNDTSPVDNAGLAATVCAHPDRLIGFGMVDPRSHADPGAGVRACIEEHGFVGIGEFGYLDITDPRCFPVYEACIDLDVPILIHLGIGLPSLPLRLGHPALLDDVVIRYPELKVIAAHCAAPWFNELAGVAVRHPNVWVDISALGAYPLMARFQAIGTMLAAGLSDRLLFGSDFPVVDADEWARWVGAFKIPFLARKFLGLPTFSKAQREALMGGNAARLLGI